MNKTNNKNQILMYQTEDGEFTVEVKLYGETVWLTQKQMAKLFGIEVHTINYHLKKVFKSGELQENSVIRKFRITANDGKSYDTNLYNLDAIISVGYRINSSRATQFRIWATRTLKEYLIKGYTLNQKRLRETGLNALESTLKLMQETISQHRLTNQETQGLLEVITLYAKSWLLLKQYDDHNFPPLEEGHELKFSISYEYAVKVISDLKSNLIAKKEAGDIFGCEIENNFKSILGNLDQTFEGHLLYPTVEEKAAHLLYFTIKDHPFLDGNKRIASLLFILYLDKNRRLFKPNGETIINDNALVAIALLIAESAPKNKEIMTQLVINLLKINNGERS